MDADRKVSEKRELWEESVKGKVGEKPLPSFSPHKNVFVLAANVMGHVKTLRTGLQQHHHHLALSAFKPTVFCE